MPATSVVDALIIAISNQNRLPHRRQVFNGIVKGVCRVLGINLGHVEFILFRNFLLEMSPIMELQHPEILTGITGPLVTSF